MSVQCNTFLLSMYSFLVLSANNFGIVPFIKMLHDLHSGQTFFRASYIPGSGITYRKSRWEMSISCLLLFTPCLQPVSRPSNWI